MTDTVAQSGRRPLDLLGVALWTVIAAITIVVVTDTGLLTTTLALPLLVFLPGYALVSVLFPAEPGIGIDDERHTPGGRTGWIGRLALAIAASPAIVAGVGYLLSATVGISRVPSAMGIGTVTLLLVGAALVRRNRLPAERRAAPMSDVGPVIGGLLGTTRVQQTVTVGSLLVFVIAVAFVGTAPADGESFTEVAMVTENETGDLVASGFETTYTPGEAAPHRVVIWNHEGVPTTYGVVTVIEAVDENGSVTARQQVDQTAVTVDDGDRIVLNRTIEPTMTGDRLRLQTSVYRGGIPDDPRPSTAAQTVHRWIAVEEGGDAA
ncbi:MAG: DUF1616 domain-containing protein [archaeon]